MTRGAVVFFMPSFCAGGIEKNAVFAANALAAAGFAAHFVFAREAGKQFDDLAPEVVRHRLGGGGRALPLLNPQAVDGLCLLPRFCRLLRRLQKDGPVAVFAFQSNLLALFAARLCRAPVMLRLSNHPAAAALAHGIAPKISHLLKRIFYRFADAVIANSTENAQAFAPLLGCGVEVIHNPAEAVDLAAAPPADLHPWLGDKTLPVVTAAGRFAAQKDFPTLLRAFALARAKAPARLIVFGEGVLRRELEALARELGIAESVAFPGFVDRPARQIARADLFVLSSLFEGLPNALIEAVRAGVPCVATRCASGPAEILLEGAGGDLVPPGDAAALGEAIARNLADPAYARMKQQAAQRESWRFDPARAAQAYASLAQRLLSLRQKDGA